MGVFGKPLGLWRDHMPKGMLLRSHWWATNLSDPRGRYGMAAFFREQPDACRHPLPCRTFIDYGLWFQERAVPDVDETYVRTIQRDHDRFLITLADGRCVRSAAVVMAIGVYYYAHRPAELFGPPGLISHSCDHDDFSRFRGQCVVVVGAGQSAIEYAALLNEAKARVHVVARRPIVWLRPDTRARRPLLARIAAPDAGIAPGWKNWVLDHLPYLFYRFPQPKKDVANRNYYASAASDWLRDRVIGNVMLHEGTTIVRMAPVGGRLAITTSAGNRIQADHLLLATGYKVGIDRLPIIPPSLRAEIGSDARHSGPEHLVRKQRTGAVLRGAHVAARVRPALPVVAGAPATARRVAAAIVRTGLPRSRPRVQRVKIAG